MIEVKTSLESVSSIIGTYKGIADAAESEKFLQMLAERASDKATNLFDQVAAVNAASRKNLRNNFNHMYEYGVAGITAGHTVIADPTSPQARLWVYNKVVEPRGVTTFVTFRDAVVPNPQPSERPDLRKVPSEMLAKMSNRKYVFKKRAEVIESGEVVNIRPKNAKALFFPAKDNGQGYAFWTGTHPLPSRPGLYHKNAFTNFFKKWWNTNAPDIVTQHAHQTLAAKIGAAQRRAKASATLKSPHATNIVASAAAAEAKAQTDMMTGPTA